MLSKRVKVIEKCYFLKKFIISFSNGIKPRVPLLPNFYVVTLGQVIHDNLR